MTDSIKARNDVVVLVEDLQARVDLDAVEAGERIELAADDVERTFGDINSLSK